ncbi:MAG: tyrosine-type recombinase/integrase [Proteobacteria bacterium]|nr:tyrosine-type recombinase/integrase [Pseudomonadota bacterium]
MTQARAIVSTQFSREVEKAHGVPKTAIDGILKRLSRVELPGKEHLEDYMRHKWRLNHKPATFLSSFGSIVSFLTFYQTSGRGRLEEVVREDLEAFVEHEQDRGLKITTVKTKLACIVAFLHFLSERDIIREAVLKRKIRLKLPDTLPRAINPSDVKKFLAVIDNARDRALILLLLRTGIRIGEALGLTLNDLDIRDRKVHLFEGEKNSMGRVVYLSDDALFALKSWLVQRDLKKEFVFYTQCHKGMCYSSARILFVKYLEKAGLEHKGYTVHSLRHTFASELLNAGMRLECLQQLLGHHDVEVTRRYARLTDKTREEEYFRAMAVIEKGGINGEY